MQISNNSNRFRDTSGNVLTSLTQHVPTARALTFLPVLQGSFPISSCISFGEYPSNKLYSLHARDLFYINFSKTLSKTLHDTILFIHTHMELPN